MNYSGKRVLVTAGANGIGFAIAKSYQSRGASVVVTDIDPKALALAEAEGFTAIESNAANEEDVIRLMDEIDRKHGGLDVLVNNAGIAGPTGAIETVSTQDWKQTFDVNIHSQFLCIKHGLPLLRKATEASIVNLSSAAGRVGMTNRSAYSASKWAVVGLTKTLAIELGAEGIRVNAICPGAVDGPRIRSVMAAKAEFLGVDIDEIASQYESQSSLNRMITVEDVANMVVFVSSDLARNVNGQVLAVDGNTEKLF
jgi:NAD(P)-dependent dehydrogenase (short-subunit alcohol dehydrogenase family)